MSALLKPDDHNELTKIKAEIPTHTLERLDHYMSYAGFKDQSDAISKALDFVMDKDKGFREYCAKM